MGEIFVGAILEPQDWHSRVSEETQRPRFELLAYLQAFVMVLGRVAADWLAAIVPPRVSGGYVRTIHGKASCIQCLAVREA